MGPGRAVVGPGRAASGPGRAAVGPGRVAGDRDRVVVVGQGRVAAWARGRAAGPLLPL